MDYSNRILRHNGFCTDLVMIKKIVIVQFLKFLNAMGSNAYRVTT